MQTAYITHPACQLHAMFEGHPESPQRLRAIEDRLIASGILDLMQYREAPAVSREQLLRVHDAAYIDSIEARAPDSGLAELDPDTFMNRHTLTAARHAAGAVVLAVDEVLAGRVDNAFCAVRPPGHHAEHDRAMGFCLFNNVAVGAAHALAEHGLERVAIVDFDVHHGNGSEDIFRASSEVLFCSSYQHPFYPYTAPSQSPSLVHAPLPAGSGGTAFREAIETHWLPALAAFRPQLVMVSAGFDGHREDEMAGLGLSDADYAWVTARIVEVADRHAHGRIVSALEGGYALQALGRSVELHLRGLLGL